MVVNFDGTFKNELMLFYFIEDYLSYVTQRNAKTLLWISLVIRQKGESQNGCFKKTKHSLGEIRRLDQAENTFHLKRDVLL